ncbi:MAG: DNA mismatch repair protein MutS [Firmicutes bacterium HGW-Firmicutes-15]|nr:MAG: DNA mismatch repair protein MutS [Firmicutes bacterium HGW-Firmicutes-15]
MDTHKFFSKRLEEYIAKKTKLDSKSELFSSMRFFSFLIGAVLTILVFMYYEKIYGYSILITSLTLFAILVVRHDKVINKANLYSNMVEINEKYIFRMQDKWAEFRDAGEEYIDYSHPYANDLDIFGHASVFQWMNVTNTYNGREQLRKLLENPIKDIKSIRQRQDAVKELASKLDFCQGLQCEGMGTPKLTKNPEDILMFTEKEDKLFGNKGSRVMLYLLPFITVLSFAIWYFSKVIPFYIPFTLVLIQAIINLFSFRKVSNILETIYAYKNKVEVYQRLLETIEKEHFNDTYLSKVKSELFNINESASKQIKRLDSIVGAVGFRYNPIVHLPLNTILFWDLHCVFALEKWKQISGASLRKWLNTVGVFEALSCLALVSQLNPSWEFAEFKENEVYFTAEDLGHPLINHTKRVTNNFTINNEIGIITGSNMSGKTTLLRTVGVNLVLAYAGAPVCAKSLTCSIMDIFTSMRISDDLTSGISTFYSELLRIKMIIDFSRQERLMIFLIDEVFRGTNSNDRIVGAKNVLMNLNERWIIGLISTHDFELCNAEEGSSGRVKNYNFIETYKDNLINFDYKIRPGRCTTTNAQFLMKIVGIDIKD